MDRNSGRAAPTGARDALLHWRAMLSSSRFPLSRFHASALGPGFGALLAIALATPVLCAQAAEPSADDLRFFEARVRPVLAENCIKCHGPEKQRSGLRLDHGSFLRSGGARGPAVVAGDPNTSLLVHAVRYDDVDLSMPPKKRLPKADIAVLEEWVRRGAPWPDEAIPKGGKSKAKTFDLAARRASHWCWRSPQKPALPPTKDGAWPRAALDRFVLARLESAGLAPAPEAGRRTWLRRVSFDLTGLPPTAQDVTDFLADSSQGAHARVVDRLLASPAYAERWAQHWLDLVRYAETYGHEFDFTIHNAWRYRDYVIRALESDVPYDQFAREHIAGDLLPTGERRAHAREGFDESILATGFWLLGDQTHSPVDARKHQADRVDNQIDVMSKTFLGVTLSCARCHDHKFDAISTKDYYAMFGFLESSRYAQASVESEERTRDRMKRLEDANETLRAHALDTWRRGARSVTRSLRAARGVRAARARAEREARGRHAKLKDRRKRDDAIRKARASAEKAALAQAATEHELNASELESWLRALDASERGAARASHPLHAWFARDRAARGGPRAPGKAKARAGDVVFADFSDAASYARWRRDGEAFGDAPQGPGLCGTSVDDRGIRLNASSERDARSHAVSRFASGTLSSPSFRVEKRFVHIRAAGRASRINLVPEGFTLLRNPIWGHCKLYVESEDKRWYRVDLGK